MPIKVCGSADDPKRDTISCTLVISNATLGSSGNYNCMARNYMRCTTATIFVKVEGNSLLFWQTLIISSIVFSFIQLTLENESRTHCRNVSHHNSSIRFQATERSPYMNHWYPYVQAIYYVTFKWTTERTTLEQLLTLKMTSVQVFETSVINRTILTYGIILYLTNKNASTEHCSVVKHARSGRAQDKCREKQET